MTSASGEIELMASDPNWKLFDKELNMPVSTFYPAVVKVTKCVNTTKIDDIVHLQLHFSDGSNEDIEIKRLDIDRIRWNYLDARCILHHNHPHPKKFIANIIQAGISEAPIEEKFYLDRTGIHHIKDETVYCAGNRVITRSSATISDSDFLLEDLPFNFDIDESLSIQKTFDGMQELILLCPIGRILIAYTISGIIRAAFVDAGFKPKEVLYIFGKTGMMKSHYIPHMVKLYNREADDICPDTRFNSSTRYIEDTLCKYNECTFIIDDIPTVGSNSIKHKAIETAEEIIRRIGDNTGRGRKDGKSSVQTTFGCNVIMIGEYPFGKESTAARMFQVEMTEAPDGRILSKYQNSEPLLVSTFYYYFIQWYVDNFDDIKDLIAEWFDDHRHSEANPMFHRRFNDAKFFLKMSYVIFMLFCVESQLVSERVKDKERETFDYQLYELIIKNQAWLDGNDNGKAIINYLKLIRKLCKKGAFRIAPDINTFKSGDYDGLIHYNCVCLRKDAITAALVEIIPEVQYRDWAGFLRDKNVLKTTDDKYFAKIYGCKGRFCCIMLNKLDLTQDQLI